MDFSKGTLSISDAEEIIGKLVQAIWDNDPESVRDVVDNILMTGTASEPRAKIDRSCKDIAIAFIDGRLSTAKFGELLGLDSNQLHDFKRRCAVTYCD